MAVHRKLKKSYLEAVAAVAERALSTVEAEQTATNGTISVSNGDGTRTVIGAGAGTDETGASNGTAYFVGDETPPGAPEGVSFVTGNGCITGVWDGSLDGGVPADFDRVAFRIDGEEFGEVNVAGSAMSGELEAGASYECDAVAYDVQGNVSDACEAISVTCVDAAAEATEAAEAATTAAESAAEAAQAASDAADALASTVTDVQATVTDLTATVTATAETATEALELATSVETSLEGFEVTVAETYATQTALAGVSDTADAAATDAASALEQVSTLSVTVEGVSATASSAYTTATEALTNAATAQATADAITTLVAESYTTTADLTEMLGDYVTDSTLSTTLESYSTTEQTAEMISSEVASALYTTDEDGTQTAIYATTSEVEQTATDLTADFTEQVTAVADDLSAEVSTRETLIRASGDGVEVAKLVDGAYTSTKTLMDDTGFHVLDSSGTELSSFESSTIELGKNSSTAKIQFCNGRGQLSYDEAHVILSGWITGGDSVSGVWLTANDGAVPGITGSAYTPHLSVTDGGVEIGQGLDVMLDTDGTEVNFNSGSSYPLSVHGGSEKASFIRSTSGVDESVIVSFGVGSSGTRKGVYDGTNSAWMFWQDEDGYLRIGANSLGKYAVAHGKANRVIQSGTATSGSISAGSYANTSVTFDIEYDSSPMVQLTVGSTATAALTAQVYSRSTTGFTARVFSNASSSTLTPTIHWMAIGIVS